MQQNTNARTPAVVAEWLFSMSKYQRANHTTTGHNTEYMIKVQSEFIGGNKNENNNNDDSNSKQASLWRYNASI